jgi:hypothetical protein
MAAIRDGNFAIVSYRHVRVDKGEAFPVIPLTATNSACDELSLRFSLDISKLPT